MKKKIQQIKIITVTLLMLTSILVDCGVKPIIVYGAQTESISEEPITNKQLDSKLSKTQQWVNSVSDKAEKSGLYLLSAKQTAKGELKLTTLKKLNDNFSSITTVTFASDNKNAEFQVVILKDYKELAVQKMSGQIEKNSSGVLFKYIDSKTKKENTVNLTSGHSSAAAAIPLAFEMVGGASELAGMTTAMTAALPAIAVIGGAAVVVGGGYYIYTKSNVAKNYPSASVSRANVANNELTSLTTAYKASVQSNNSLQTAKTLSSMSGYLNALNTNVKSISINVSNANTSSGISRTAAGLNQMNAGISGSIAALNQMNAGINKMNDGISGSIAALNQINAGINQIDAGISGSIAALNQINAAISDSIAAFNQMNAGINKINAAINQMIEDINQMIEAINQMRTTLEDYFRFSAVPNFSSVTYNKNTKILNLVGSMPSESIVHIYVNGKIVQESVTDKNGNFTLNVNINQGEVAIDAIQKPINGRQYKSCSIVGLLGFPTFTIHEDGDLTADEETNKHLKTPLLVRQTTASPTFDKVTYDSKTKTLNLVGSMPSASTLDIYIGDKKIRTEQTTANGSFNIKVNVENNSVAIRAIQNPTNKIKYVEPLLSTFWSYPKFTVQADGTIFVNSQANKLLKQTLQEQKYTASPVFSRVTYDSKTKTLNLIGDMPSASTLDIYIGYQKIRTEETDSNGHFDIKVKVENDRVSIDAVQKSTTKFKYTSFLGFWGAPTFHVQKSGEVACGENVKLANGVFIKIKKFTPFPKVDEVVYNEKNDSLTIPITMSIASQFTVYRNSIKVQTVDCEANKKRIVTVPLEKGDNNIKISISGKDTSTTVYQDTQKLEFSTDNGRNIKATSSTNISLKEKLPVVSVTRSGTPTFSDISFDTETNTFNISGKMLWKGTITPYLNGEKLQSISTDEAGRFKLSIPVKRDANGVANIAIDGVNDETKSSKYSSYMDEIDFSTFMIDASGNISVSDFIKNSIIPKQVVTPLPNVDPIPVGKGVTVQGKALPNSDVTVKNRGIEYGGKADDKGIFSIPVPEILVNDVVEIFVKAPSTAVISYTTSEAVSVQAQSSSSEATVNKDTKDQ